MKIHQKETIRVRPDTFKNTQHSVSIDVKEQRILSYAIYKKQKSSDSVSFTLQEINDFYNVQFGSFRDIKRYIDVLRHFGYSYYNEEDQEIVAFNAFSFLSYKEGLFRFKFNDTFLPILNEQKRYLQLGLVGIQNFKCRFSLYLYNWLKDNMYGAIRVKENISLTEFRSIFLIGDKYKKNNSNFKIRVWQPAVDEINTYTGYRIQVEMYGRGDKARFTVIRIEDEVIDYNKKEKKEKPFECYMGKTFIDYNCIECMRVNQCPFKVKISKAMVEDTNVGTMSNFDMIYVMADTFLQNEHYNLYLRVRNKFAKDLELRYYDHVLTKYGVDELTCSPKELQEILESEKKNVLQQLNNVFNYNEYDGGE